MKLTIRIIAIAFLTVVLITGCAAYLMIHTTYADFEVQRRDVAEQVAEVLAEPLRAAWRVEGITGVDRLLREETHLSRVGLQMRWVWFEDDVAPEHRPHSDGWPPPGDGSTATAVTKNGRANRQLHIYVPIALTSNRHGALEVSHSLEPLDRSTVRRIQIDLAALGTLALVSLGVAYWTGMVWIARPLQALIAKTQQIGQGQLNTPLDLKQRTEFGNLATAFNDMCRQLAEHQAAIQHETTRRLATLEQLRQADRLTTVGRLAAGIAHEMGTPLNVVAGRAALIASGKLSAGETKSSAATIKSEADRITGIVRHLLDFARHRPPQRVAIDVHALAAKTTSLLQQLARQKNARIDVAPSGGVRAFVDPSQIEQVLMNLLANALQALPNGGTVRVEVGMETNGDSNQPTRARISVSDNGTGIAESDLPYIFEPFFTTKDVGQGTGLGLSIAYGIVQEHGGRIDVSSDRSRGTCFTVFLPSEPHV